MATAPPHPCPSCRRLVVGTCDPCARRRRRERGDPSATARGYDWAWAVYSRDWLARFPYCGMRADGALHPDHSHCAQRRVLNRGDVTDHIVAIADGGARMDPRNHQTLCYSCNARKGSTADVVRRAERARARG